MLSAKVVEHAVVPLDEMPADEETEAGSQFATEAGSLLGCVGVIKTMQAELLDDYAMAALSVVTIDPRVDIWDVEKNEPTPNGLLDLHMGALSYEKEHCCKTCNGSVVMNRALSDHLQRAKEDCPGHFGRFELPLPVTTVLTVETITLLLRLFCFTCGSLLIRGGADRQSRKLTILRQQIQENRLGPYDALCLLHKSVIPSSSPSICYQGTCESKIPQFRVRYTGAVRSGGSSAKGNDAWFHFEAVIPLSDDQYRTILLPPNRLRALLKKIDVRSLIAAMPSIFNGSEMQWRRWISALTPSVLLVAPLCVRPTDVREAPCIYANALTKRYVDIAHAINKIREFIAISGIDTNLTHWDDEQSNNETVLRDKYAELQYRVDQLYDVASAGGRPSTVSYRDDRAASKKCRSILNDLHGKEGRFRHDLEGKRTEKTMRTVLGPDPRLSVNQVAIPMSEADNLSIPERVTELNQHQLTAIAAQPVTDSRVKRFIIDEEGNNVRNLAVKPYDPVAEGLVPLGVIVERPLRNGDIALINRQPTLHRPSMTGVRVRLMPRGKTVRINLTNMSPLNADCDGDELNVHIPQTISARVEAETLMYALHHTLLSHRSAPAMGLVQDALLAVYLLSRRDVFLDKTDVCQLVVAAILHARYASELPIPAIVKAVRVEPLSGKTINSGPLWTGKQLISLAIPSMVTIVNRLESESETDARDESLLIVRGQLLRGRCNKSSMGTTRDSIVHRISTTSTTNLDSAVDNATASFLNTAIRLGDAYLFYVRGFSVGPSDMWLPSSVEEAIADRIAQGVADIERASASVDYQSTQVAPPTTGLSEETEAKRILARNETQTRRQFEETVTRTQAESDRIDALEGKIIKIQDCTRDDAGKIATKYFRGLRSDSNSFMAMEQAGSKGSPINISQISAVVGGQTVDGRRVCDWSNEGGFSRREGAFNGRGMRRLMLIDPRRRRVFPHFPISNYPCSVQGGFCRNCFMRGLRPHEFWCHACGGRQGLVDTATRTAESGYLQRRMSKGLEDKAIAYDNTVRNCEDRIISFAYGTDPAHILLHNVPEVEQSADDFARAHLWEDCDIQVARERAQEVVCREKQQLWEAFALLRRVILSVPSDTRLASALNVDRVITEALAQKPASHNVLTRCPRPTTETFDGSDPTQRKAYMAWRRESLAVFDRHGETMPTIAQVIQRVDVLCCDVVEACGGNKHVAAFMVAEIRIKLASKAVLRRRFLSLQFLETVASFVLNVVHRSRSTPGDAVGMLAAQSLGEPATQMTLKSFHFSGISLLGVISGIDRFKELVTATKVSTMKTTRVNIFLDEGWLSPVRSDVQRAVRDLSTHPHHLLPHEKSASQRSLESALLGHGCDIWQHVLDPTRVAFDGTSICIALLTSVVKWWSDLSASAGVTDGATKQRTLLAAIEYSLCKFYGERARPSSVVFGSHVFTSDRDQARAAIRISGVNKAPPCDSVIEFHADFAQNLRLTRWWRLMQSSIPTATTDEGALAAHAFCERVLPFLTSMRTLSMKDVVSETRILHEPISFCDGQFHIDFSTFTSPVARLGVMAYLDAQVAANNDVPPFCAGSDYCPGDNCVSNFVLVAVVKTDLLLMHSVSLTQLEDTIRDRLFEGKAVVVVAGDNSEDTVELHIRMRLCLMDADEDSVVQHLREKEALLLQTRLSGPPGKAQRLAVVTKLRLPFFGADGREKLTIQNQLVISTAARDFQFVMGLRGVDTQKTVTNSITEIERVLGIEAARAALVEEIDDMIRDSSMYVDIHHIELLADTLCTSGRYTPLTRHAFGKLHSDFIQHATFEDQRGVITSAALNATRTMVRSPSTAIICGQYPAGIGTNAFEVMLDTTALLTRPSWTLAELVSCRPPPSPPLLSLPPPRTRPKSVSVAPPKRKRSLTPSYQPAYDPAALVVVAEEYVPTVILPALDMFNGCDQDVKAVGGDAGGDDEYDPMAVTKKRRMAAAAESTDVDMLDTYVERLFAAAAVENRPWSYQRLRRDECADKIVIRSVLRDGYGVG